jgi:leucyl-tRNA synthetase
MKRYNPKEIEARWQKVWQADKTYETSEHSDKPKRYVLEYFPYPSGAAMHVGHVRNYTIGDVISRFNRMRGHNVLHPMGWDAFGLPAENYAIKTGISPSRTIQDSTKKFRQQLIQMGFDYDWSREINSSDPDYYKWTQWFFLLLFKRKLAYRKESLQWWCPADKTVLANEQVEDGKCWRCGSEVEKKALPQWFFKITEYADRLLDDLEDLNWSESIKSMQRNWIGRSKGAEIDFYDVDDDKEENPIKVFTTRPDTLFGATFLVLAPEHPLVEKIARNKKEVNAYIKAAQAKSDIERQETDREKTGVFTGAYANNPVTAEYMPIWVADYVLGGYGTGAIMAVPAHDERDHEFAKKFDLPITRVIKNDAKDDECTTGEGIMINSGDFDGQSSSDARENIVKFLQKENLGTEVMNYKIRDWLISRQRYWGAPIPTIHCPKDGPVAVPEKDLPVVLPQMKSYEPSGDGRSPLANVKEFVNVKCPKCGGDAERETDTMDGFACSSWYFLRFADPNNTKEAFDKDKAKFWLPVDDYIGGAEHAVMHLLYARFWTKVMYDEGLIDFKEPFTTLRNQGMILAPDGRKMSKSWNNTIEPDDLIDKGYGADSIRLMELFIGPWDQSASWSTEGIGGTFRFLQRVWTLTQEFASANSVASSKQQAASKEDEELLKITHKTIKKVSQDLEEMSFNTAIATLMETTNQLYKIKAKDGFSKVQPWKQALKTLVQLLAPFAPHITEELWSQLSEIPNSKNQIPKTSVHLSTWPVHEEKYLKSDTITIVVQVNGKVRANIIIAATADEKAIIKAAQADVKVSEHLKDNQVRKTIYVPQKLINFVA